MEWWAVFLVLFGGFALLIFLGLPVAFSFLVLNLAGSFFFMGGTEGIRQLVLGIFSALANFTLTPIPLFIFMGEIIFRSGVAFHTINILDGLLGRVPGRLSLLAVASSTLFSGLTGSAISNTALLGSTLIPEMKLRGYGKPLMIGPIIGTGGLAMMIPPSALAVVLGSVAHISIGGILLGGILPGLLMASLYTLYIIVRALASPSLAPAYDSNGLRFSDAVKDFIIFVLPLISVVLLVVGSIYGGIATPTEAAALGCTGSFILSVLYGKFSLKAFYESLAATTRITCMTFLIIAGSVGYSQIIAFTGAGQGITRFLISLSLGKTGLVLLMLAVLLVLGCFMDQIAMIMVTTPFFMPIINELAIEPVWFAILVLIALDVGFTSPPFGLLLFLMKGIAPEDITMGDIYKASLPFILCNVLAMAVILLYPAVVLYLPGLVR